MNDFLDEGNEDLSEDFKKIESINNNQQPSEIARQGGGETVKAHNFPVKSLSNSTTEETFGKESRNPPADFKKKLPVSMKPYYPPRFDFWKIFSICSVLVISVLIIFSISIYKNKEDSNYFNSTSYLNNSYDFNPSINTPITNNFDNNDNYTNNFEINFDLSDEFIDKICNNSNG